MFLSIFLFIIILGVLVFVHEFGHFSFAKLFNVRVDEFGFGFPPRVTKLFRWKETIFTLNTIPFGGFVRIFGEDEDEVNASELKEKGGKKAFFHLSWWKKLFILLGGVIFNFFFAWFLIFLLYVSGDNSVPIRAFPQFHFEETRLIVSAIRPDFPAAESGIKIGDEIKEYYVRSEHVIVRDEGVEDFSHFIQKHSDEEIGIIVYRNNGTLKDIHLYPKFVPEKNKYYLGLSLEKVGDLHPTFAQAFILSGKRTFSLTKDLFHFIGELFKNKESFNSVTGPVGIVKEVKQAQKRGLKDLIFFTAFLSLNLAVLNILPIPALDGGRILFVLLEKIRGKKIKAKLLAWIHGLGFIILILLMIFVTVHDVIKLF